MDNRIFNVNGRFDKDGQENLAATLRLVFQLLGHPGVEGNKAVGYRISPTHGFVLYKDITDRCTPFACKLGADQVFPQIVAWFESNPRCERTGWDAAADHDGHNGPGWRVYCEDWGHVDNEWAAFIAIKPAFMWYGK